MLAEATRPLSFALFLEKMKEPAAQDLVRGIKECEPGVRLLQSPNFQEPLLTRGLIAASSRLLRLESQIPNGTARSSRC